MSERDHLRLAANVLGILLVVAAVSPFVVYAVPEVVGADHGFVVLSGSMEPEMSPGDAVIVREVSPSEIERNDVITFRTNDATPTTHRVVEVQETEDGLAFKTKGDANEDPDQGVVQAEQLVGEVTFVIPYLGFVIQFVNTQLGFLALVVVPLVLFVLSELWALVGDVNGSDSKDSDEPTTATTDGVAADVTGATPAADAESAATSADDADGSAGAATTETLAEREDEPAGFVLTRSSLQLIMLLLAIYAPYSGYVAYTNREAWTFAVAIGTGIALLFALVIYLSSDGSDGSSSDRRSVVRRGELPSTLDDLRTVSVESVESLVDMALDRGAFVVYDDDNRAYYLREDDAVYVHRSTATTDGGVTGDAGEPTENETEVDR